MTQPPAKRQVQCAIAFPKHSRLGGNLPPSQFAFSQKPDMTKPRKGRPYVPASLILLSTPNLNSYIQPVSGLTFKKMLKT